MSNLTLVQDRVADHMDKIHTYFKPGVCVTVIVRTPGFPERDFLHEIHPSDAHICRRWDDMTPSMHLSALA
jgi:hypothetical protein